MNTIDGYRDTVEDGIAMVKGYIESLAKDDATKALVNAVFQLLSRDGQGNIKASRVAQLRKMAEDSGNEQFLEGVKIIEEAYQPTISKKFIRAQYKNDKGSLVLHSPRHDRCRLKRNENGKRNQKTAPDCSVPGMQRYQDIENRIAAKVSVAVSPVRR